MSSCHLGEASTGHRGRVGTQKGQFRSKFVLSGPLWPWIWTWKRQTQVQLVSPDAFQWYVSSWHLGEATTDHRGRVGPQKGQFRSKLVLSGPLWPWIWTWKRQIQVQLVSPDAFQWYVSSCHLSEATTDHQGRVGPQKSHFRSKLVLSGPLWLWIWTWKGQNQVQVISPDVFQWYLSSFNLSEAITDHQGQVGPQKGHFRSKWDLVGPLGHQMWLFENPKMVFINDLSYHHHLENFLLQYKSCVA